MKLEFPKVNIETSRAFENEEFSLGDPRVLMELLSSAIYARPKYIVVQEVASNARDANREAGRADVPIQIKLPNSLSDNLIIADSGPGISPDRMSNVFLCYGESTKRDGNEFTGGFGIGAKTPFTYTDTFNIVTITDDEDGRHKRTYIAHKSDNGFAKMSLVGTEETDDDTGTSISFAVESKDFSDFAYAVKNVCNFWSPRPKVTGAQRFSWKDEEVLHKGTGWELVKGYDAVPLVLIDRIPYKMRLDAIFRSSRSGEVYQVLSRIPIRMYFETGEVNISATREDLDYKDKTIKAIKERAAECLKALKVKVAKIVEDAPSLWDATILWRENAHTYKNLVVTPDWKGQKLMPNEFRAPYSFRTNRLKGYKGKDTHLDMREAIKVTVFERDGNGGVQTRKSWGRNVERTISVSQGTAIIVDDIGKSRPNRLRLKTFFQNNPNVNNAAVVLFKDSSPTTMLYVNQEWYWASLPKVLLSSIPKAKSVRAARNGKYTVNAVKVLRQKTGVRSYALAWTPCKERSPEDDKGGVYVILRDGKPTMSNGCVLSKCVLGDLAKTMGVKEIHGILYKYRNKVSGDWTDLLTAVVAKGMVMRASKVVGDYIKYGDRGSVYVFGKPIHNALLKRVGEIQDQRLVDFLNHTALSLAGKSDWNIYSNFMKRAEQPYDSAKSAVQKEWEALKDDYPAANQWQSMLPYNYNNKPPKSMWIDELIFYLNAKFAAKPQGVTNANP